MALPKYPGPQDDQSTPMPFLKWAGGKRTLVPYIQVHKQEIHIRRRYWEPFLGGGAVFLGSRRYDLRDCTSAHLSDLNLDLITTWKVVRDSPDQIIEILYEHQSNHMNCEEGKRNLYYYLVRDFHTREDPVALAARFIYLNRTCYNGLYRVNSKGHFNVPEGRYKRPVICNEYLLRKASEALQGVSIDHRDFEEIQPGEDDFVYCDPPYDQTFNRYQSAGFTDEDQTRLRNAVLDWRDNGANVMVSSSDTPLIRDLYGDRSKFRISLVTSPRNISAKSETRGKVMDLLIRTI